MGALTYLVFGLMFSVAGVLCVGVLSMARGGEFNRKNANKLMKMRVILQGVALLFLGLIFILSRQ